MSQLFAFCFGVALTLGFQYYLQPTSVPSPTPECPQLRVWSPSRSPGRGSCIYDTDNQLIYAPEGKQCPESPY